MSVLRIELNRPGRMTCDGCGLGYLDLLCVRVKRMTEFTAAVAYALSCLREEHLVLKDKQVEVLQELYQGNDVFAWFPTGYGKSVCYQLLPFLFDHKLKRTSSPPLEQSVVLVISPLVSLMVDQVNSLYCCRWYTQWKQRCRQEIPCQCEGHLRGILPLAVQRSRGHSRQ